MENRRDVVLENIGCVKVNYEGIPIVCSSNIEDTYEFIKQNKNCFIVQFTEDNKDIMNRFLSLLSKGEIMAELKI